MPPKHQDVHLECPLEFAADPQPSMLLRITPMLREALLEAHAAGHRASITVGEAGRSTVITVGSQHFEAAATPEGTCELVKLPPVGSGMPAIEIGVVQQKLLVKRKLARDRDWQQTAAPSKPAIKYSSVLFGHKSAAPLAATKSSGPVAARTKTPGASLAAAARGGCPAAPRPIAGKQLMPAGGLDSGSQPAARKPQPKSKLGLPRAPSAKSCQAATVAAPLPADVLQLAVTAAQLPDKKRALRLCIIALLSAKPITRKKLEQAVAEVRRAVVAFKPTLDQWRGEAGRVGEYRAPGVYHLHIGLASELETLPSDGDAHPEVVPVMPVADTETAANGDLPTHHHHQQQATEPHEQDAGHGKPSRKRLRKAGSIAADAQTEVPPPAKKCQADAPELVLALTDSSPPPPQDMAPDGSHLPPLGVPPSESRLASVTREQLPRGSQQLPVGSSGGSPTAACLPKVPCAAHVMPAAMCGSPSEGSLDGNARSHRKSCSASIVAVSGDRGKSASGGGDGGGSGGSGSRSSGSYDEAWFTDHTRREAVLAPPCVSPEEFEAYRDVYQSKYGIYFRLHQELQAHKREMEGLHSAALSATSGSAERARWMAQLESLWSRRRRRCLRWEAAHSVLHTELQSIKGALRQYAAELHSAQKATSIHVAPPPTSRPVAS